MVDNNSTHRRLAQIQDQLAGNVTVSDTKPPFAALPAGAQYLHLNNSKRRNALSKAVLLDMRAQLRALNTSSVDGQVKLLPPFDASVLQQLEAAMRATNVGKQHEYSWLVDAKEWRRHRQGLPQVIFLRSEGPVFCSGHDLNEVHDMSYGEAKDLFALCAEVMTLIRRSPTPVISVVQGLATAAGAQLALATDHCLAHATTQFRLPGSVMGLPCISPVTAVSRKVGNPFAYQMLSLSESYHADQLPGMSIRIVDENVALENVVMDMAEFFTKKTSGQGQAWGKWAYWTQVGLNSQPSNGDGLEAAVVWTGKVMALLAQTEVAKEGISAFLEKRQVSWDN